MGKCDAGTPADVDWAVRYAQVEMKNHVCQILACKKIQLHSERVWEHVSVEFESRKGNN